jgi:hypothetical protein
LQVRAGWTSWRPTGPFTGLSRLRILRERPPKAAFTLFEKTHFRLLSEDAEEKKHIRTVDSRSEADHE